MKENDKRCILSIKYSILDTSSGAKAKRTEVERVFIANDKNSLLKNIKNFEDKLQKKPGTSFLNRKLEYIQHFLSSWRYTYNSMLKI